MQVVLVDPEIPQNTGSVARLCAATRTPLHLVGRLGFSLDDRYLKRAGLDYWPEVELTVHEQWNLLKQTLAGHRFLAFSARSKQPYTAIRFRPDDILVFGRESTGLPQAIRAELAAALHVIPIVNPAVRSLNLANAVAIVLYEGIRQLARSPSR